MKFGLDKGDGTAYCIQWSESYVLMCDGVGKGKNGVSPNFNNCQTIIFF